MTNDPNPWEDMFTSIAFAIVFRAFYPILSLGCFLLSATLLYQKASYTHPKTSITRMTSTSTSKLGLCELFCSQFKIKDICLLVEAISNLERTIYLTVDPFFSQRLFSYATGMSLLLIQPTFVLFTNMILAVFIRKLINIKGGLDALKRWKKAYFIIGVIITVDLLLLIFTSMRRDIIGNRSWIMRGVINVLLNILLGSWYLYIGIRFLIFNKKSEKTVREINEQARILILTALVSATTMIIFGALNYLVVVRSVFGIPWGHFGTFASLIFIIQIASLSRILLFAGVVISPKILSHLWKRPKSVRLVSTAKNDEDCV
eukprot:c18073_g2_i2.p1 GENE.c18073_g2_i2~~c18073_g2_i2.p1  ORF type:complete len:317 (-),score=84.76 c18073_g2_i2:36-986(-)